MRRRGTRAASPRYFSEGGRPLLRSPGEELLDGGIVWWREHGVDCGERGMRGGKASGGRRAAAPRRRRNRRDGQTQCYMEWDCLHWSGHRPPWLNDSIQCYLGHLKLKAMPNGVSMHIMGTASESTKTYCIDIATSTVFRNVTSEH
jgi:hypothetical protein